MTEHLVEARSMRALRSSLTVFLALLLVTGTAQGAAALEANNKQEASKQCAKVIKEILQAVPKDQWVVSARAFNYPGGQNVGIIKDIADALANTSCKFDKDGKIVLTGDLERIPVDESMPLAGYTIHGQIRLPGAAKKEFVCNVRNAINAAEIFDQNVAYMQPPDNKPEAPVKKPTIVGKELRPSPTSPYGIEILVASKTGDVKAFGRKYEVRDILGKEGAPPTVELKKRDLYAIRISNRTKYDAVASIFIDGLSSFALAESTAARAFPGYRIPPGYSAIIPGYYHNAKIHKAFLVGGFEDSVAQRLLPNSVEIGTIKVSFFAAWQPGKEKPSDEDPDTVTGVNATHAGPDIDAESKPIVLKRGAMRAILTVRY